MALDPQQRARYDRHLKLPQIGVSGQEKLRDASVLLIGAGGLGSPVALYLAAAGVGTIGIVDHDVVDISNLQRQVLHDSTRVGHPKVDSARERLTALNPDVAVIAHHCAIDADNAFDIIGDYDVIIDGSDNFTTRYLVNDACVFAQKPNVHGAIYRFEGQASVFAPGGPCYRCIFPSPPPPGAAPSCEEAGVLGVLPGVIGTIQATEALKLILGIGRTLVGRLLVYDALEMRFRELRIERNRSCALCGDTPTITSLQSEDASCEAGRGDGTISVRELAQKIAAGERLELVDVREQHEWNGGHLERARHIPLGSIERRWSEISPDQLVVVYCAMGGRSARAATILKEHGFTNVVNLEGGMERWRREIGALERSSK